MHGAHVRVYDGVLVRIYGVLVRIYSVHTTVLGTLTKAFSQGRFPNWQFSKLQLPNVQFPKRQLPKG